MSLTARDIIKHHVTTERTTILRADNNEYVFHVDHRANKYSIKLAVEELFKVKVESVRTMIMPGKSRRLGWGRPEGRTPRIKKAIVKLKENQAITMFDNV